MGEGRKGMGSYWGRERKGMRFCWGGRGRKGLGFVWEGEGCLVRRGKKGLGT